MFKVGDRVRRKPAFYVEAGWIWRDKIVTIKNTHNGSSLSFDEVRMRWDAENFEPVLSIEDEIAELEKKLETLKSTRASSLFKDELDAAWDDMRQKIVVPDLRINQNVYFTGKTYSFRLIASLT